jgi:hypothetical protein
MTAESVVTLPFDTLDGGSEGARVRRTRTRARVATTFGEVKDVEASLTIAQRALRTVYLDAADSWIVSETSPALRTVWATDYAGSVPGGHPLLRGWCRAWKPAAVLFAAVCDGLKWLLAHPLRGPLFLFIVGAVVGASIYL